MTKDLLTKENAHYRGTLGVSNNCAELGYLPAFKDTVTGEIQISLFADGRLAPIHVLDGLPKEWVVKQDGEQHPTKVKDSVVAGFVRNGIFFTREQLADKPSDT